MSVEALGLLPPAPLIRKFTLPHFALIAFFASIMLFLSKQLHLIASAFSIIRYVIQRRVEEAQKLLLEGTLSLKKIAETVGFEDYNYFARTFKKATGRTPREYKNSFAVSANELS